MEQILVLYGTLTGNTEMAAKDLRERLAESLPGPQLDLANVRDILPEQLASYDSVVFGTSTWDESGNPDTADFLSKLAESAADLARPRFALFGLGDSSYQNFCGACEVVKSALLARGGQIIGSIFTIDGYPQEENLSDLAKWAEALVNVER